MALKFDPALFSQATANLPASTSQATEQQPQPTQQSQEPFDLNSAMKRYGIYPEYGRNDLTYEALNEQMRKDGLESNAQAVLALQQEWKKSLTRFGELSGDEDRKARIAKKLREIDDSLATKVERTAGNVITETYAPRLNAAGSEMDAAVTRTVNTALAFANDEDYKQATPQVEKEFPKAKGKLGEIYSLVMNARQAERTASSNPMMDVNTLSDAMFELEDYAKKNGISREEMEKIADRYYTTANALREQKTMEAYNQDNRNKVKYTRAELEALSVDPKYLDGDHFTRDEQGNYLLTQDQEAGVKRAYSDKRADRVAGLQQRRQELQEMGNLDFAKQALLTPIGQGFSFADITEWLGQGLESSVSQLPERSAQIGLAFLSRGSTVAESVMGQVLWNSGTNLRLDTREAFTSTMEDKAKKHGWDMNMLTVDQYAQLEKEAIADGSLPKSIEEAQLGSLARSANELLTTGSLETASEMLRKAAEKSPGAARKAALGLLSVVAGTFAEPMGEVQGDAADALVKQAVKGEELDLAKAYAGAGNTFMATIFSAENAIQRASKIKAALNERKREVEAAKEQAVDTTENNNQPADKTVQPEGDTPSQSTPPSDNKKVDQSTPNSAGMTLEEKDKLFREYEEVTSRANEDGVLSDEDAKRATEIEALFQDEDGNNTLIAELNEWNKNGKQVATQGTQNEDRTDDRTSTPDVGGQTNRQGTDEPNASGTERGSETSEPVSPTETETPTTGHSQSDPQSTPNPFEQSDNNTPKSNATGLDGRTSETDSTRGEQGELGQNGSEQSGEPTQATSETSTDSGVQQRPQSNSVGETLTPEKRKERIAELENQEREDLAKAESDRDTKIASDYAKSKSGNNAYANSNASQIERDIQSSADAISRFKENGDQYNVEREDEYLRQAYARKEQITGKSQLEAYKQKRQELGLDKPLTSQATEELNRLRDEEKAYDDQLNAERRKYDEIASIKVGKAGSKENIKNLPRATDAISEATELDNARVAYEKAKELAETIPSKKSRQAKLDEIEQAYAKKQGELKTDTFANRERMEANKAKRDEKRAEAEEEKRKHKDRIRERLRNRKRDSGPTEQSEPQTPVASGEQTPVSDKGTETSTPSDTSAPEQPTKPTSATKPERKGSSEVDNRRNNEFDNDKLMNRLYSSLSKNLSFKPDMEHFAILRWRDGIDRLFGDFGSKITANDLQEIKQIHAELKKKANLDVERGVSESDIRDVDEMIAKQENILAKTKKPAISNSERLQYPKDMSDEDIIALKERMDAFRETVKREVKGDVKSRYDFGFKRKNKDHVIFTEHSNGTVTAEIHNAGGVYTKTLESLYLAKAWVDQTLIGKDNKQWNGKSRKLVEGDGVFHEIIGNKEPDSVKEKREWVEQQGGVEAVEQRLAEIKENTPNLRNAPSAISDYVKTAVDSIQATKRKTPDEARQSLMERANERNKVTAFEKENRINSAIDNAVSSEEEKVKPYLKEFKTGDLRSNQKRASELLKDNPKDADQIKEAFFDRTPNARPASWGVVERGYIRFDVRNPNHKAFKGTRVGLLGFDFDGNAVYGTEEMAFDDIKKSDTTEDITTITLAEQPKDTRETTDKAVENVIRTNPELEQDMRDVVEEFAKENDILEEDGSPVQGTNENIAWASNNSDFMSWLEKGSKALHAMFKKVQNVLAGVIAVVAVGAMTVPNDAMAHTGYSVYESGPKIENVSQQASDTINWVVKQKDHNGKAFVVADKAQGKILIVDTDGKILNTQNAIFGKNKGDSSAFGNTPSGRFLLHKTDTKNLSDLDKRVFGDSVLDLTDKETGRKVTNDQGQVVAMHRVVNTAERKAALNSATPNDNYLSHGCINIPTAYYNSAVDKLDGAMVYVLGQDGKSNMSNDTAKSSDTTRSTTKASTRSSSLEVPKTSKLNFSVKAKDIANISDKVSVEKLQKALEKTLGDLADKVNFITEDDFGKTKGFDKIRNAGVEGFYDPINQRVYIVADNIEAQNGLTAEERMAWVAWHELVHNGLDVKYGEDLRSILYKAQANPFISDLARAIMLDRRDNQLVEVGLDKATEEALAELGAALKTGNVKSLADRYGVQIPVEYQSGLKGIIGRHLIGLRNLVGRLLGKKMFTTKQVERLLEDALKEVNPDKATKDFAQKAIEDVNDPNSALAQAVMFSVAKVAKDFVDDVTHIVTGGDISRTGSTPARDGTKSAKERATRQGFISRLWTGIQDAQQVIIDLDPEGNGGRLSNAVATFSNKAAQMSRKFRPQIKSLEMEFNKFASENKDLFPHRKDRRQIDHVVQDVTSSLRAITGGNESIRKRVETTIFGEDIYDDDGNFIKHNPGLADRVNEYAEYISNAQQQGLQPSSYITAKLKEYTQLLEDQLAIQDKFDQADDTIIARTKNGPDVSRKDWRGHDGFTTAEAEQKLRDLKAKGFIDLDIDSFTKVPYQVKRYVRGKNGQPDSFVVETHYRYETSDLQKAATGRIMPLVDKYVDLSQKMYQTAVRLVGKDIMGNAPSEAWQVGTMGKVRNAYTTKAKDAKGQEIDNVYDVSQSSNIDTIISLRQAAEYQSRLNGRAFNGGTALENLTWHIDLMSKQAASQNIGRVMLDMSNDPGHGDKIKVYRRNDKDYSTQNGILVTRNKIVNGKPVLDQNGDPVKEVVKVAFADEEANRALFGDNIAREELTNGNLIARALFGTLSSLTRLGSLGLTGSLGFSVSNAYKGYNEKVNQILAWTKDSPFVKSLPRDIQDKYFNNLTTTAYVDKNGNTIVKQVKTASSFVQGSKLQALIAQHKAKMLTLRLPAMEVAATRFAQELIDNVKFSNVIHKVTGWSTQAEAEYQKLVKMYEEGGISSRVEELVSSNKDLKARFATGPLASKIASGVGKTLDFASSFTMSQELVSSLMMYDFLTETLDMPPEKAIEANLHFMNFNKRGNWKIMDYIRKYTMFGNAIAQGSKAFQNAWVEQTNDVNDRMFGKLGGPVGYKLSDRAVGRAIRNIAIGAGMNLFLRMLAENMCDDKDKGMGSPFDRLNPYELMRDMPVAYNCGENGPDYFRFPVEYGTGNVENAIGVGFVQYMKGAWSLDQTKDFMLDSLRDNALPVSMPVMKTNDPFQLAISFLMPIVPEPMKGSVLAFGGIDDFGNPLNSMSYQFKDYKPGTGKKTTDSAWTDIAEALYGMGIFGNLSPEQAKVLATSWTQGVFRNLLTNIIEEDPKQSVLGALLGSKSLLRDAKGYDKAAYTTAQTYLQDRYKDLNEIAIRAEGTKNGKITDKWLKEHGYEMDEKERKLLTQVEKYRKSLRNKTASQERRYENNVDFIKSMRAIEGYDDN